MATKRHSHIKHFFKANIQVQANMDEMEEEVNDYLLNLQYPESVNIITNLVPGTNQDNVHCMVVVVYQEIHANGNGGGN